jgi:CheY-like chemotaxis protein
MKKTIMIVEDRKAQRLALQEALRMRGFHVESAGNVRSARALAKELQGQLDVMVLDMRLEDVEYPNVTGADIGLEVLAAQRRWPPEFLILTVHKDNVDYYKLALKLRVAAYLHKDKEEKQEQIIRHIRALSLRRALSVERPNAAEEIQNLAETSRDRSEAITRFCKDILAENFIGSLGAPFIVLLTENNRTQCCVNNAGLPDGFHPLYDELQVLALAEVSEVSPFVLEARKLAALTNFNEVGILEKLDSAAFLPLSITRDFRLFLGILQDDPIEVPLAENAREMAKVLAHYFKSVVLEHLLNILSRWAELDARRKAVLKSTSQFCLYVGQEQLQILQDAEDSGEWLSNSPSFEKLQALAIDLRDTGKTLLPLTDGDEGIDAPEAALRTVRLAGFIRSVWEDIDYGTSNGSLEVQGDCRIHATNDDLLIIVSRLLHWMAQRFIETSSMVAPSIRVTCNETDDRSELIFEDNSRRLGKSLRERLFFPFTQAVPAPTTAKNIKAPGLYLPLYLAKMLVEVKYRGVIEDHSDNLRGEIGHKFLVRFPSHESLAE